VTVQTETVPATDLDRLAVDTVRVLAMDAIEKAGSGHPGTAMALAPAAYVLWTRFLKFDPADPEWPARLSAPPARSSATMTSSPNGR
jgi:transketolase